MLMRTILASMFLVSAGAAFAGNNDSGAPSTVSLDDLKAKCKELTDNPQLKPIQVKITCNELSYYWVAGPAKAATLPNLRNVGAVVQMKGYEVPHAFFPVNTDATAMQCQTFVKNQRQVANVDVEIGCQDLASITDLGAYCAPILDARVAQDSSLVTVTPTSDVQSFCPAGQ
jgi:hypothetical protein